MPALQAGCRWFEPGTGHRCSHHCRCACNDRFFLLGHASTHEQYCVDSRYIYAAYYADSAIGGTGLDGAGAKKNFIVGTSEADAVVARSNYSSWINGGLNSIARAGINGDAVNR
jgi:hypothetical protein